MNKILLALLLVATPSLAAIDVQRRDLKLATQQLVEKQTISGPALAGSADVLSAHAGSTAGAPVEVTSFVAQPDVARNLVVTPGGTAASVRQSEVIIYGTDLFGVTLMEVFAIPDNHASAVTGSLAFSTITKIVLPGEEGAYAASWSVGYGEKLGMKRCMDEAGHLMFSTFDGAYEATRPTVVVGASVASNTADINGTMDGSKDSELFFFQNFVCLP
jgi:hypothetical protein